MKFRNSVSLALCAFAAVALPAFSETGANPEEGMKGAKGMFFDQLEKKDVHSTTSVVGQNTGVRYWIELKRGDTNVKVNNKHQFKTGDRIRFHVIPNIDGYAYVLLTSGSRGERAVLFPETKKVEGNKVFRGRDVVIPGDGYLAFDENPGTEKVQLVVSRLPIDATAYLNNNIDENEPPTMIASATEGSKDLIPTKVYVSYGVPHAKPIRDSDEIVAYSTKATTTASKTEKKVEIASADVGSKRVAKVKEKAESNAKASSKPAVRTTAKSQTQRDTVSVVKRKNKPTATTATSRNSADESDEMAVTTVVKKDSGTLHVDVTLDHN